MFWDIKNENRAEECQLQHTYAKNRVHHIFDHVTDCYVVAAYFFVEKARSLNTNEAKARNEKETQGVGVEENLISIDFSVFPPANSQRYTLCIRFNLISRSINFQLEKLFVLRFFSLFTFSIMMSLTFDVCQLIYTNVKESEKAMDWVSRTDIFGEL